MTKIFLKPTKNAEGAVLTVIDPETKKALPAEGGYVNATTYWKRRLADGDVEKAEEPVNPAAKPAPKKPLEK